MKGFLFVEKGQVPQEWIDRNGHMNVVWYTALFDQGTFFILDKVGINTTTMQRGHPTVVANRINITHRREFCLNDEWELWVGFSAVYDQSVTITHRLTSNSKICATCDIKGSVISPHSRKPDVIALDIIERANRLIVPGIKDHFTLLSPP